MNWKGILFILDKTSFFFFFDKIYHIIDLETHEIDFI